MIVTKDELCTGCGVCADACPNNCITIQYDSFGFLKSNIDSEKCVNCKICTTVCPANHPNNENEIFEAYKARRRESSLLLESSSGGIASLISETVIKDGGVVAGCAFDDNLVLRHSIEDKLSELEKFKGSKYVQSYVVGIYKTLKEKLNSGKTAVFIGTPCQVSALKNYLGKDYENLYTVDLICHGVGSGKILYKYLDKYTSSGEKIKDVKFREKKSGYRATGKNNLRLIFEDKIKELDSSLGIVLWFAADVSLRESCYQCGFVSNKRCSDISLADYIGEDLSTEDKKYGTSMVFINTEKGKFLFEKIAEGAEVEEKAVAESVLKYKRLNEGKKAPRIRKRFFEDLSKLTLEEMEQKYTLAAILPSKFVRHVKALMRRFRK